MLIVDATPQGAGWSPISHMVRMASNLFSSRVDVVEAARQPPLRIRAASLLRRRVVNGAEEETCLVVCASPADLLHLIEVPGWRRRFRFAAAWVIDSFWIDWIPRTVRMSMPFDHVFISSGEDIEAWHRKCGVRPSWLPWGTDALDLGSDTPLREWDLTRVGRQPAGWDDDDLSSSTAETHGIRFRGRPRQLVTDPIGNQSLLMQAYAETKFTLAFSNLANPTNYTHPTREYITGRWVDALAAGATVAGCPPRGSCIDSLLWPGATLDLGTTDRATGLNVLGEALSRWTPDAAQLNYTQALARLDWRHRFRTIADMLGEMPEALANDLRRLEARCQSAAVRPVTLDSAPGRRL